MTKIVNFEKNLQELQDIVVQLEKGDLALEQALKQFEKGIKLARICQDSLVKAEQKLVYLKDNNSDSCFNDLDSNRNSDSLKDPFFDPAKSHDPGADSN